MAARGQYRLNPETLLYEMEKVPMRTRVGKVMLFVVLSLAIFLLYLWLYVGVLGWELPKTTILRKRKEVVHRIHVLVECIRHLDIAIAARELAANARRAVCIRVGNDGCGIRILQISVNDRYHKV